MTLCHRGLIVNMQTDLSYVKKIYTKRTGREKTEQEGNMLNVFVSEC